MSTRRSKTKKDTSTLSYSFWRGALRLQGSATKRVLIDVLRFGMMAFLIVLACKIFEWKWGLRLDVPNGPFSAGGAVLGLLLVLRTNAGYDRWWEARKLWGGIVNQSRNLAIAGMTYGPKDPDWRTQFIARVALFPHVVRLSLRNQKDVEDLERLVGPVDVVKIATAKHAPTEVSRMISQLLQEATQKGMSELAFFQAENQRALLVDHLGACERIRNTPLARSSAIHIRRFIFLFLVSLPFAFMSDFMGERPLTSLWDLLTDRSLVLVPLFIMLLAYPLLSLDRIGMELQNPFDTRRLDHLPIDGLCRNIERQVIALLTKDEQQQLASQGTGGSIGATWVTGQSNSNDTLIS